MKRNMKNKFLLLASAFLLLSSCNLFSSHSEGNESINSQSVSDADIIDSTGYTSEADRSEDTSEDNSDITEETYEKDEENFYILDEDDLYTPLSKDGKSQIEYSSFVDEKSLSLRMFEQGNEIPLSDVLTNASQRYSPNQYTRVNNSVGIIRKRGEIDLLIQTNFSIDKGVVVRPTAKGILPEIDIKKRTFKIHIKECGQYTIEFRMNRTLHLFVDDIDEYNSIDKNNYIYFAPGIHNKDNDSRIDSSNNIRLYSNQKVFIDYGAIIEGSFISDNCSNITLIGGGIISGKNFSRDASLGTKQIPYDFNYCTDVTIEGLTTLDPAGWTYNMYFCNRVTLKNLKIISSRANGDGISIQSCQSVDVSDCFVRSWDDSLVVKNYNDWSNPNIEGETRDITFTNCLLWTDLAQSMEVGFETIGQVMEGIHFKDITVLHNYHKPAISIHNGNNADIRDVTYENIIIEDASMGKGDGKDILIEISCEFSNTWSTAHKTTSLGSIKGVSIKDVQVLSGRDNLRICIRGSKDSRTAYKDSIHTVEDVHISSLFIKGEKITENYPYLATNEYVSTLLID